MRTYTWDEYYEKFYDWAESTQLRNLSALTSLGSADEVSEIIIELQENISASNRLLRKAVAAKIAFSSSDLLEFAYANDKELVTAAVHNSVSRLSAEDMEELYGEIDDEDIIEICKQQSFAFPEDLREDEEYEDENSLEDSDNHIRKSVHSNKKKGYKEPKKIGFWGTLGATLGVVRLMDNRRPHQHSGRCNGDCTNCPPHYGYRYGRWYYGHGHIHGCEFGGNNERCSME